MEDVGRRLYNLMIKQSDDDCNCFLRSVKATLLIFWADLGWLRNRR